MTSDWPITRGEKKCATCERTFDEREKYFSALYDRTDTFERKDYCMACWEGDTAEMFSFWQTEVPAKEEKQKLLVDDDVLLDFFGRLEGASDELKVNFRYILSLVLMRKKLLRFRDVKRTDAGEFLVMQLRGEKTTIDVLNPQLDEEKIAHVTEEVGKILNVQL